MVMLALGPIRMGQRVVGYSEIVMREGVERIRVAVYSGTQARISPRQEDCSDPPLTPRTISSSPPQEICSVRQLRISRAEDYSGTRPRVRVAEVSSGVRCSRTQRLLVAVSQHHPSSDNPINNSRPLLFSVIRHSSNRPLSLAAFRSSPSNSHNLRVLVPVCWVRVCWGRAHCLDLRVLARRPQTLAFSPHGYQQVRQVRESRTLNLSS